MENLTTERLVLKPICMDFLEEMNAVCNASFKDLSKWMVWCEAPNTLEETRNFIEGAVKGRNEETAFEFSIFLKETGEFIGNTGLHLKRKSVPSYEMGYWIGSAFHRQGYMPEAGKALLSYAFDVLGANRVFLRTDVTNAASRKVAKRELGAHDEGILANEDCFHGKLRDTAMHAHTPESWKAFNE